MVEWLEWLLTIFYQIIPEISFLHTSHGPPPSRPQHLLFLLHGMLSSSPFTNSCSSFSSWARKPSKREAYSDTITNCVRSPLFIPPSTPLQLIKLSAGIKVYLKVSEDTPAITLKKAANAMQIHTMWFSQLNIFTFPSLKMLQHIHSRLTSHVTFKLAVM